MCTQPRIGYSEAQVKDLLHLRRLYYGKLGQLYRQRKELRSQVPLACMGEVEGICATHNYTLLSSLAEKLRVNAADEYSVFLQSFCAIFRGVGVPPLAPVLGLYGGITGLLACCPPCLLLSCTVSHIHGLLHICITAPAGFATISQSETGMSL